MSKRKQIFNGVALKNGGIVFENIKERVRFIKSLSGKKIVETIKIEARSKTPAQNKYYHGVVVPFFAEQAGYKHDYSLDLEIVRDELKSRCGVYAKTVGLDGTEMIVPKSIADYTIEDYKILIDNCNMLSVDMVLGMLPKPE